jgi:hypothetical protein
MEKAANVERLRSPTSGKGQEQQKAPAKGRPTQVRNSAAQQYREFVARLNNSRDSEVQRTLRVR